MIDRETYRPGPASGAHIDKDGDDWTLVVVRELRHSPEKVWEAITDPAQLREWAPYEADRSLAEAGATVKLTTVGAPKEHITETTVTHADAPHLLEFTWGGGPFRWQLDPVDQGTRLTLHAKINRRFIAMGAAGMHVCLDVMEHLLDGKPIGRRAGPEAMQMEGWHELFAEYSEQFGVEMPKW